MILIETFLSTLTDKQLDRYSDPKIQPYFAKGENQNYQHFEQEVDDSDSKYSFIDTN